MKKKSGGRKNQALPNHIEPRYTHQLNDTLPLVGVGDTTIQLFIYRIMKHALLKCDDSSLHVNMFSLDGRYIFLYYFYVSKKTKLILIHFLYNENTRIKSLKNPYIVAYKFLYVKVITLFIKK